MLQANGACTLLQSTHCSYSGWVGVRNCSVKDGYTMPFYCFVIRYPSVVRGIPVRYAGKESLHLHCCCSTGTNACGFAHLPAGTRAGAGSKHKCHAPCVTTDLAGLLRFWTDDKASHCQPFARCVICFSTKWEMCCVILTNAQVHAQSLRWSS